MLLEIQHQSLATESGSGVDSGPSSDGLSHLNMSELWEMLKLIVIVINNNLYCHYCIVL